MPSTHQPDGVLEVDTLITEFGPYLGEKMYKRLLGAMEMR